MWAEGPYLHAFANLGRPPFSASPLTSLRPRKFQEKDAVGRKSTYIGVLFGGRVAKGAKKWAVGPYLHSFGNLGRLLFSFQMFPRPSNLVDTSDVVFMLFYLWHHQSS